MDWVFIKALLLSTAPFIFLIIIDHFNMKNKIIITDEEIEEAANLLRFSEVELE